MQWLVQRKIHANVNSDVTWAPRSLKSSTTQLLVQQLVQVYNKENIKFPQHWPFMRGTTGHRWLPSHKAHYDFVACQLYLWSFFCSLFGWYPESVGRGGHQRRKGHRVGGWGVWYQFWHDHHHCISEWGQMGSLSVHPRNWTVWPWDRRVYQDNLPRDGWRVRFHAL